MISMIEYGSRTNPITNEVNLLWHKDFSRTSMKKKKRQQV